MAIMNVTLLEPAHWIMQTRQFTNLKHRVERGSMVGAPALVESSSTGGQPRQAAVAP